MDAQLLVEFKTLTRTLLDAKERQQLQQIITTYKDDENFGKFIDSLKIVITSTDQCQLLPFIRLFLLRKHRHLGNRLIEEEFLSEEDKGAVTDRSKDVKPVTLSHHDSRSMSSVGSKKKNLLSALILRNMNESLGIGIRGGMDFGCGIFISDVQPDSPAAKAGLRLGDQILYVNNVSFESITANAAARFLASAFPSPNASNVSRLRVIFARTGMIPAHRTNRERIAWSDMRTGVTVFGPYVVCENSQHIHSPPTSSYAEANGGVPEVVVNVHVTLSFAIRGGRDFGLGIFIAALGTKDADCGQTRPIDLRVGDEIIAVNGRDLRSLRHSQAADFLRHQKHLSLTVKHIGKYPLYKEVSSEVTWTAVVSRSQCSDSSLVVPTTSTQNVRTELPWETVVTVRRNSKSGNNTVSFGDYNSISRPVHSHGQRSAPSTLAKSSSGSLIIDASNVHRQGNLQQSGGSLRSSWTTSASIGSGNCSIVSQPAKESFVFSNSLRRRPMQAPRTPISTIQFDEISNNSTSFGMPSRKQDVNSNHSKSSFQSVNARVSRQCGNYDPTSFGEQSLPPQPKNSISSRSYNRNDCDSRHRVGFSDEEKSPKEDEEAPDHIYQDSRTLEPTSPNQWGVKLEMGVNTGAALRPPSVAVKGRHTTLVKLPKRPDTSLGLGVSGGGDSPDHCLRIDHALPNSIAGEAVADGLLQPGCLLLAVDGQSLVGASHEDAVSLTRRCFRDATKATLNLLVSTV